METTSGPTSDEAGAATDEGFGVGSTVGPYLLVRRIGDGGMGLVFEGVHLELEKRVAVKVLHSRVDGPAARERFVREGRAAARVRHPNAVEVFDTGVDGGVAWLAMEYLAGEDLAALLVREGVLTVTRVADLMLPVVAAVGVAHAQGIVHRDLKPENVFLAEVHQGMVQPKVLDFGVARLLDENNSLTRSGLLLGTPFYMSPEQVMDSRTASILSDQYSLGVVMYQCATGRLPFAHESLFELLEAIVRAPLTPPRAIRPELPEAFEAVVLRALEHAPERRFPSVHALGAALLPFATPAMRAVWEPVFSGATSSRTLVTSVVPPALLEAPRAPSPRETPTLDRAVPHRATLPSPPRAAPPHRGARWVALALAALTVAGAVAALQRPAPDAQHRPVAPPAAPESPPLASAPTAATLASDVAAPPAPPRAAAAARRGPATARPGPAARASVRPPPALHRSRPDGVLILR